MAQRTQLDDASNPLHEAPVCLLACWPMALTAPANLALAEMYVQGVSTRKVITVLEKLVGPEIGISSTQISRCTALLGEGLRLGARALLDETPYVILDVHSTRLARGQVHYQRRPCGP